MNSRSVIVILGLAVAAAPQRAWCAEPSPYPPSIKIHGESFECLRISSNNRLLAATGSAGTHLFRLEDGKHLIGFGDYVFGVNDLQFCSNDRWLVTTGHDGNLRVWETDSGKLLRTMGDPWVTGIRGRPQLFVRVRMNDVAVLPNQTVAVVAVEGMIQFWNLETGKKLRQFAVELFWNEVDLDKEVPPAELRELLHRLNLPKQLDGQDSKPLVNRIFGGLRPFDSVNSLVVTGDGNLLVGTNWHVHGAFLAKVETGEIVRSWPGMYSVALSPNDKLVAGRASKNSVGVFEAETGKLVQEHEFDVCAGPLAFTPDSNVVVFADMGQLIAFEVETGKTLGKYPNQPVGDVATFVLSTDGKDVFASWRRYEAKYIHRWKLPR